MIYQFTFFWTRCALYFLCVCYFFPSHSCERFTIFIFCCFVSTNIHASPFGLHDIKMVFWSNFYLFLFLFPFGPQLLSQEPYSPQANQKILKWWWCPMNIFSLGTKSVNHADILYFTCLTTWSSYRELVGWHPHHQLFLSRFRRS